MINSLKSNKTSWENELRKLQSSDEYGINFKKLLVAEGSERYYAAKKMLNEKDKLENQTFLLALKEGEKMMLSLECNDKFKAPKMDHIDELPTKEMLLTSAGIKQTMDKLISTAKEVTPKSKIAFINRNQWSKKSMFLESKIRSHLNGTFPNISTFLSFHHKKHKSTKFGIIDSFHLPLMKGETPCVTRLYSRWEYYHNCFVLEEEHCYSSDFENILSNILQNISHTSNIPSYHTPIHSSIPMKGILKAITIDNTLHLRPLCSNKDFQIALNEMVQPSAIFKEAYIQLPDNIKCDHMFKRDSFALYRCSTSIDIKQGIRHTWQSITCNILEQEGARDGLLDCFLCPVMCPQAYTFTPVPITAVSPVLTSLMTSLTKALQDITEHGMVLSSFTVDLEAAYEHPSHATSTSTGQSSHKLMKPVMSGLNSPVVMNASTASTTLPVNTSRSRNGHRGGTTYQAATGNTIPSAINPSGISGIRPSPPPPPGSDTLPSSHNYLTSTTVTGKEGFFPEPTFARVLHLCTPPNYIYVDEFQESRRLLVEQAISNTEMVSKGASINNTTGSIDALDMDTNNNNNSNTSTNSYHSSASHTPLLNQTNKSIFDEAQLEASKPMIQTQLSLRSLLSQYSSSTKIRPRLGSGLTTEEEEDEEEDTLLKSPKYKLRKGTIKKPLLLLLKKDTINHITDRKADRKSKISKKEKDWFKKKRKNGTRGSSMNVLDSIDDGSETEGGGTQDKDDDSFKQASAKLTLDQLFGGNVGDILLGRTRRGSINRHNVVLHAQNLLTAEANTTPSSRIEWDPQDDGEGISLFASKTKRQHGMHPDKSHRHQPSQGTANQGSDGKLSKSKQMEREAEEVIAKMFTALPTDDLRMELLEFLSCYNQLLEDNENENEEKNYQRRKRMKQRELKPEDNKHHPRSHGNNTANTNNNNKKPPKILAAKSNHFIGEEDIEEDDDRADADDAADSSSSDSLDDLDDETAGGYPGSLSLQTTNGRRKKKTSIKGMSLASPKKPSAAITPLVYTMIRYRGGVPGEYIPPSSTAFAVQSSLTAPTSSTSESIIFNLWSNNQANRAVSRQKFTNRRNSTTTSKNDQDMLNFLMRMNHIHHNINTMNKSNASITGMTPKSSPSKDAKKNHNSKPAQINDKNKKMYLHPLMTTGTTTGKKKSKSLAPLGVQSNMDDNNSSVLSLDISLQSSTNDNSSNTFPSPSRTVVNTQSQSQSPKTFDKKKIYSKNSNIGNPIANPTTATTNNSTTVNTPTATSNVSLPVDFLSNRIKRPVASAMEPTAPVTPYLDIADTISNEWWSKLNATEDVDDIIAKKITTNQSNNVFYALPRLVLPNLNGVYVKGENKGIVNDIEKASIPRTQSHHHSENHRSGSPVVVATMRTIPPTSRYGSLLDQMHSVDENKSFAAILREVSAQFTKEYGIPLANDDTYSPSPSDDERSSTPTTTASSEDITRRGSDSAPRTAATNTPSRSRRSSLVMTMEQQQDLLTLQEQQSILNSNTLHGVLHHLKSMEDFEEANTNREVKRPPYRLLKMSSVVREEEEEDSGGDDLHPVGDSTDGPVGDINQDESGIDRESTTVSPIKVTNSNSDQFPNNVLNEGDMATITASKQGLNPDMRVSFAPLPLLDKDEEDSNNNNPTSVKKLSPKKEDSLRMTTTTYHPDLSVNRRGSLGFNTVNITAPTDRTDDGRFTFLKLMPELRSGNINLSISPPRKKSALLSSGLDSLSLPNHAKPLKPSPRNNRGHSNSNSIKLDNNNSSPKNYSNTNFSTEPSNLHDNNNPTIGLLKVSGMFTSHPHSQNEPEPPKESKKTSSAHMIGLRSSIRKKSTPAVTLL